MIKRYLAKISPKVILPTVIGVVVAVLNLVLTLNLMATVIIFVLVMALVIFFQSFSQGWLFLLGVALLFPAFNIGVTNLFLFDLFLVILVIISLSQFIIENHKIPFNSNKLSFYFFLIFLIGASILFFNFLFGGQTEKQVWQICFSFILYWFLLISFQYFFQTAKRIRKFFYLLIIIGVVHSVFGLAMFLGGWQTSLGMGISGGNLHHVIFDSIRYKINGFLGIGLEEVVGPNFLAAFLVISIITTLGFYLLKKIKDQDRGILEAENLRIIFKKYYLLILLTIQVIALVLTSSYLSLISLMLGVLTIGILLRRKKIVVFAITLTILLTAILPIFNSASKANLSNYFDGIQVVKDNWVLGNGINYKHEGIAEVESSIFNSYLFIWNFYGVAGIIVLMAMLLRYFMNIYEGYKKTEELTETRVWLAIITAIFVSFIIEATSGNVIIFGPTAIVFWLLYAIVVNLKKERAIFGLTSGNRLFTFKDQQNVIFREKEKVNKIDSVTRNLKVKEEKD